MKFHIITIFPEAFSAYFNTSILKRAIEKKLIKIDILNLRKFGVGKHKIIDDKPYGGGVGMVLKTEPILKAVDKILIKLIDQKSAGAANGSKKIKIIMLSASGGQFTNKIARDLAIKHKDIIFICGRYEGIDERVKVVLKSKLFAKTEVSFIELSIGPYIITGGELASMVLIDAVSRQIKGVLGKEKSIEEERGYKGFPLYTRPEIFKYRETARRVPKILLSGNEKKIEEWRKKRAK